MSRPQPGFVGIGAYPLLTHWGWETHICVGKLTIIGSDNGLSPDWRQAIIWTNAGLLLIGPLGTNFSEILIEILTFSFKKLRLKVSSGKWLPFCLGLNVLVWTPYHSADGRLASCRRVAPWELLWGIYPMAYDTGISLKRVSNAGSILLWYYHLDTVLIRYVPLSMQETNWNTWSYCSHKNIYTSRM